MKNYINKLILQKYPDYDFDRYRFKFGDIVTTNDLAKIFIISSGLEYVDAFVLKSSFTLRKHQKVKVKYSNLPYFTKGEFTSEQLELSKSLRWKVGDFVYDKSTDMKLLLTEEVDNGFYALVVDTDKQYYRETSVFVMNPYADYIVG